MAMKFEDVEQPKLAEHDSSVLDMAFAMDTTGSMGPYIKQAQQNIRSIVEEIVSAEKSDVRLALVEFRDHPPQERSFVTRVNDFTESVKKMKGWLDASKASGGGDTPEAVADALHQVLKLSWRKEATKICVFIADAPPHGLFPSQSTQFKEGCPDGLDPVAITHQLAEKGIVLYVAGCEPNIRPSEEFYSAMAFLTGGQYVPLVNAKLLAQVIIGGAQEEITLQRLQESVNQDVQDEYQKQQRLGAAVDEDGLAARINARLKLGGARTKKLTYHGSHTPEASSNAKTYAACSTLGSVRGVYDVPPPPSFSKPLYAPVPLVMSAPGSGVEESPGEYGVIESDIAEHQSSRMVQKAMKMNKFK